MLEKIRASPEISDKMQVAHSEELAHVVIVHHQDDVPIQLEDRYVSLRLAPDFLQIDFDRITPTRYLLGLCIPDEIEHIVQAVLPDQEESRMLCVPRKEPCLRLLRRTFIQSDVVTLASMLYPGSRYDLMARYAAWTHDNLVTGVNP